MPELSRRAILAATALAAILKPGAARARTRRFTVESGTQGVHSFQAIHEGLGSIDVRMFAFDGTPAPANFLIYDIPPGASEGVHVHSLADPKLGPFDEYYYIIEGRGRMMIDSEPVTVTAGDHVHTPIEVPHGIENIDPSRRLKVFLTYIDRSSGTRDRPGFMG